MDAMTELAKEKTNNMMLSKFMLAGMSKVCSVCLYGNSPMCFSFS